MNTAEDNMEPIQSVPRVPMAPLSFAQERMWFLDQLVPDSSMYSTPNAFRVDGHLDIHALEAALTEIVRRHEVLRTTYHVVDGVPGQTVRPSSLCRIDRRTLCGESAVTEVLEEEARRPFDLSRDEMVRVVLLECPYGGTTSTMFINMPHIASDGWSFNIFMSELASLYMAFREGMPPTLATPALQYADYAVWTREHVDDDSMRRQMEYWRDRLAGLPETTLPADRPRPARPSHHGARMTYELPAKVAASVWRRAQQLNVTAFTILCGAFAALVSGITGETDVVFGTPLAGRTRPELEGMLGCFLNTAVIRLDLSGNPTVRELTQSVRQTMIGAFGNQEITFEKLVRELRPSRDPARSPFFQLMFVLQNVTDLRTTFGGITASMIPIRGETSKCDLVFSLAGSAGSLTATVEYATDLFDSDTVTAFCDGYRDLLAAAVADVDAHIQDLPGHSPRRPNEAHYDIPTIVRGIRGVIQADLRGRTLRLVADEAALAELHTGSAVQEWRAIFDAMHHRHMNEGQAETFGWVNTFTREPFTDEEIGEWVDTSVEWIRAQQPRQVLELGCGLGLLARRLVPAVDRYVGTDLSAAALEDLKSLLANDDTSLPPLELRCQAADDLSGIGGTFDTIVINSVVQYFPDAAYLQRVLSGALKLLKSGGVLMIGDVRNAALAPRWYAAVEANRAPAGTDPGTLQRLAIARACAETELLVSPEFFRDFATRRTDIADVSIELRRGWHETEMNAYRYNVVFRTGAGISRGQPEYVRLIWRGKNTVRQAMDAVRAGRTVHVVGIPNPRVEKQPGTGSETDPGFWWDKSDELGSRVRVGWLTQDGADATYEVWLGDGGPSLTPSPVSAGLLATVPNRKRRLGELARAVFAEIEQRVPAAERPQAVQVVNQLPSGDAEPPELVELAKFEPVGQEPTPGSLDDEIAAVWSEVLGHRDFDDDSSFFDVGGHSMLLVRVRDLLAQHAIGQVPLMDLFRYPTVRSLARHLAMRDKPGYALPGTSTSAAAQRRAALDRQRSVRDRIRLGGNGDASE
jgi:SAM-dependent methyltransferase